MELTRETTMVLQGQTKKVINWIIYRTKVKEYIYHENSLLYDTDLKQIIINKKKICVF